MAHPGRDWAAVTTKLANSRPLALATEIPEALAAAAQSHGEYRHWFADVFDDKGDTPVTAARIAFAIATYERTLVSDQTPYDLFAAGNDRAMTRNQVRGFRQFRQARCDECHVPPHFTDHQFRNIGVRPYREDSGRQQVTEAHEDRGKFKVPSLRNVGLRPRLMHNGEFDSLANAVRFYHFSQRFGRERTNNDPILGRGLRIQPFALEESPIVDFLRNALTDPRVAAELPPFDRPQLQSERAQSSTAKPARQPAGVGPLSFTAKASACVSTPYSPAQPCSLCSRCLLTSMLSAAVAVGACRPNSNTSPCEPSPSK